MSTIPCIIALKMPACKLTGSMLIGVCVSKQSGTVGASEQASKQASRVAQWERAGPITQRSMDRNHPLLSFFLFSHTSTHGQDYNDPKQLLSPSNIDTTALKKYTVEAADFSTKGALPLTFLKNNRLIFLSCR